MTASVRAGSTAVRLAAGGRVGRAVAHGRGLVVGRDRRTARFQVVGVDGRAWLLVRAPDGWSLEAAYD